MLGSRTVPSFSHCASPPLISISNTLFAALVGWLSDFPKLRKKNYLIGLVTTALSTVAFALGQKLWILVLGRVGMALSTALVRTAGLAMLKDSSADNKQGRIMGHIAMTQTLGQLAGPLISGWLYEKVSYGAVWIAIGVLLCIDAVACLVVSDPGAADGKKSASGTDTEAHYENSPNVEGHDEQSSLLQRDHRTPRSQSPFTRFLLDPRVMIALWLYFLQGFLRTSLASTLPIYLHKRFAINSGKIGVLYLMSTVPVIFSIFIGMLFDRLGPRRITATGALLGVPAYVCLRFVTHNSPEQTALLVILLLLCGFVMLLVGVPSLALCSTVASEIAKPEQDKGHPISISGKVFATVRAIRAVGQALGPAFGALAVTRIGWGGMTAVLGGICGASFIAVTSGIGARKGKT